MSPLPPCCPNSLAIGSPSTDYWIEALSFNARPGDFRARPPARILMSSDLPLPIKRANSSAVNGRSSSPTRGWPPPKKPLNQRPSRCIRIISTLTLQRIVATNVPGKLPPRTPSWTRSCSIVAQGFGQIGKILTLECHLISPGALTFRLVFRTGGTAGISPAV